MHRGLKLRRGSLAQQATRPVGHEGHELDATVSQEDVEGAGTRRGTLGNTRTAAVRLKIALHFPRQDGLNASENSACLSVASQYPNSPESNMPWMEANLRLTREVLR